MKKREEAIALEMKKTIEEKSGNSIEQLKQIFGKSSSEQKVEEAKIELIHPEIPKRDKKRFILPSKKPKGSKPHENNGKQLTWF